MKTGTAIALALVDTCAIAQTPMHHHHDMATPPAPPAQPSDFPAAAPAPAREHEGMAAMAHDMAMPAALGSFAMNREASGTAWQPDSTPMYGHMLMGRWSGMALASATLAYDRQGGPRGSEMAFVESMAMVMASRSAGSRGRIGLRAMLSLDPLMGKRGYPLLFATGETADGVNELVDRQHPHDLFMELAATYSRDLGGGYSAFLYAGLPGEPALGPPTFMHRVSGMDDPQAPIGHHWFDSTHITWGVVTGGLSGRRWKLEASAFRGREPDQHRWDIERPHLDSWSVRASLNPTANLSFQASTGRIRSPEQLHPGVDEQRTTVSVAYNRPLGAGRNLSALAAWSLKDERPGPALHAWLGEVAYRWSDRHTVYGRAEHVQEAELFEAPDPLAGQTISVAKLSLGYQYELPVGGEWSLALGGVGSAYAYPARLDRAYGSAGVKSAMLYARLTYGSRAFP